jgi:hypothetical protein
VGKQSSSLVLLVPVPATTGSVILNDIETRGYLATYLQSISVERVRLATTSNRS